MTHCKVFSKLSLDFEKLHIKVCKVTWGRTILLHTYGRIYWKSPNLINYDWFQWLYGVLNYAVLAIFLPYNGDHKWCNKTFFHLWFFFIWFFSISNKGRELILDILNMVFNLLGLINTDKNSMISLILLIWIEYLILKSSHLSARFFT